MDYHPGVLACFILLCKIKHLDIKNLFFIFTGSKVCSYYSNKFKDGTHIKFIGDLPTKNEEDGISKLGIKKHKTPGIL